MSTFTTAWWRIAVLAVAMSASAQKPPAQQGKAQPLKPVRLYVLNCGTLNIPDTSPYQLTKQELATTLMSAPCFLIVHPKGTLLWDAGPIPDSNFTPDGKSGTMRYAVSTKTLTAQLAEIGYIPSDITYLGLSHFHWDHVGNANLFAGSTWLVRKVERDLMFTEPFSPRTEPQNYSALKNAKTKIIITNDYDVFGDGTVIIKLTPGHSPGHQVLYLKLQKTGHVMLSGDLYHYPEERKLKRVPTTEFNADQTIASRRQIEEFLMRNNAQLWIQHDYKANAKLKKSPRYYE